MTIVGAPFALSNRHFSRALFYGRSKKREKRPYFQVFRNVRVSQQFQESARGFLSACRRRSAHHDRSWSGSRCSLLRRPLQLKVFKRVPSRLPERKLTKLDIAPRECLSPPGKIRAGDAVPTLQSSRMNCKKRRLSLASAAAGR